MSPELSRVVSVDRLPASVTVEATGAECLALAARLRIPAVRSLRCVFALRRRGNLVEADGALRAAVVQSCVVSLEPVEQAVDEAFSLRFVPAGSEEEDDDPESPDELAYEGSAIDLGEAAAEQLALALDPYPRAAGAAMEAGGEEAGGEEAGGEEAGGEEAGETPFAGLAALFPRS